MAKMDNVLDKQVKHLERIEQIAKTDRLIQLGQLALEKKIDDDEKKDALLVVDSLDGLNKTLVKIDEKLSDKGALAKKVKELGDSIKSSVGAKITGTQAKGVTEAAMKNQQYFRTMGDRLSDAKAGVKNFFTMRGFLDKTGIVSKGSGGMLDTMMARREAKQQYIKDRIATDPQMLNLHSKKALTKSLGAQFESQQGILRDMNKNEAEISRLEGLGYDESKIKKTGLLGKRTELAESMMKVDPRSRAVAKELDEKAPKIVKKKSSGASESTADKKAESTGVDLSEAEMENQKVQEAQLGLLTQIEENTRPPGAEAPKKPADAKAGGGFLDGLMGFLGDGLMAAFKFIFNPKNLLKAFTKVFAPIMIVGSLVNGLLDGFKAWQETGSLTETLIAGLGGILDFLTFGLIDAETVRDITEWVSSFVDEYILQPITEFFDFISTSFDEYIVQPLKNAFEPVIGFFTDIKDTIFGFFENFEIPGISFSAFGKQFGFGPWHPFKDENKPKTAPAAPSTPSTAGAGQSSAEFAAQDPRRLDTGKITPAAPSSGNTVAAASSEAEMAKQSQASAAPVVIAPQTSVSNNSAATYAIKSPVRNPAPPINFSKYAV